MVVCSLQLCRLGGVKAIYAVTEHCVIGARYNDTSILMSLLHIWRLSFVLGSDISSFYYFFFNMQPNRCFRIYLILLDLFFPEC